MSFLLALQYRIEYVLLRAIIEFVRLFPLDVAASLSARIWRVLAPFGKRHKRALDNIARAFPDKPQAEREAIILKMWENLGRVMAETMLIDRLIKEPHRIEIVNDYVLDRYRGKMGAVVGVSLHMGNWELSTWPLTVAGVNPAAVYRLVKNPLVDAYLRRQRADIYPGGLFAKGRGHGRNAGLETVHQISGYIRQGGRVGFVADLFDKKGIPVPFFGHDAPSTPFPAMLARKLGARMWIGRCVRKGDSSHFLVEMKELKVPRTDDAVGDIKSITAAMQKQFEDWICECPDQWMWSNRKWS